jgi:hypothetical protein
VPTQEEETTASTPVLKKKPSGREANRRWHKDHNLRGAPTLIHNTKGADIVVDDFTVKL